MRFTEEQINKIRKFCFYSENRLKLYNILDRILTYPSGVEYSYIHKDLTSHELSYPADALFIYCLRAMHYLTPL